MSLASRLGKLDSGAISDAMDSLGKKGVALGIGPVSVNKKVFGQIVTVKLGKDGPRSSRRHLGTAAIDSAKPGDVIVVANEGRLNVAAWGGILSAAAQAKGVAGVIVDGACRDLDDAFDLGFPIFARGCVPITARRRVEEVSFGTAVSIAELDVSPGDYVIADRSGVVFVPSGDAQQVITLAEEIAAREVEMSQRVRAGESVAKVMGERYESLLDGIGQK